MRGEADCVYAGDIDTSLAVRADDQHLAVHHVAIGKIADARTNQNSRRTGNSRRDDQTRNRPGLVLPPVTGLALERLGVQPGIADLPTGPVRGPAGRIGQRRLDHNRAR